MNKTKIYFKIFHHNSSSPNYPRSTISRVCYIEWEPHRISVTPGPSDKYFDSALWYRIVYIKHTASPSVYICIPTHNMVLDTHFYGYHGFNFYIFYEQHGANNINFIYWYWHISITESYYNQSRAFFSVIYLYVCRGRTSLSSYTIAYVDRIYMWEHMMHNARIAHMLLFWCDAL